jgi:antitoxin (DNA-binding transcriptional repressor) of toxin-antitoxin stability system
MSCSVAYCLAMSTLALEKLPKTFASLVREGKTVHLTDKGKVVATVAPKAKAPPRVRKPKMTFTEFARKYLDEIPARPDLDTVAFLRAERDRA